MEAGPNLLAGFDETCWQYYTKHLRAHNVDVRTGCAITAVDPADDGRVSSATMANGSIADDVWLSHGLERRSGAD